MSWSPAPSPPPYLPHAACRGSDADFFPTQGERSPEALALCRDCPERGPCLAFAVATPWLEGIWAGTGSHERQRLRRQARPPVAPAEERAPLVAELRAGGLSMRQIADELGVSRFTIGNDLRRMTGR